MERIKIGIVANPCSVICEANADINAMYGRKG